jgi:hypothetical protein
MIGLHCPIRRCRKDKGDAEEQRREAVLMTRLDHQAVRQHFQAWPEITETALAAPGTSAV